MPKQIVISERQISESLAESIGSIIEAVKVALEHTAPEKVRDIVGLYMTPSERAVGHCQVEAF